MWVKTEKIRQARREKDYSQEYMADLLGLSQSQYSRIENDESGIDLDKVRKIAEILEISPLDLLNLKEGQSFVNCSQSGNIETIHSHEFDNERRALQAQIEELKADKEFLKQAIVRLREIIKTVKEEE